MKTFSSNLRGTSAPNTKFKSQGQLTRASMLADVCLVVVWGASIPGLMWLGALGGF